MKLLWCHSVALAFATASATSASSELLFETLSLEQFNDGKVMALFNFTRTFTGDSLDLFHKGHFSLFPKSFGEIVQSFGVEELHLTFTQGRWQYEKWGYSAVAAAPGVQLWSWFNASDIDYKWKGLTNGLAGSFCASLNFIDQSMTAEPYTSFAPEGYHDLSQRSFSENSMDGFQLRYGALPREITCTENLTPWTKLLPCRTKSGIASLFNAYRLFDTDFHSMSIHLRSLCEDSNCSHKKIELTQTLTVVFDPIRMSASRTDDWSLSFLFDRRIHGTCPLASETKISVLLPSSEGVYVFPEPESVIYNDKHPRYFAEFDLPKDEEFDIKVEKTRKIPSFIIDRSLCPIRVHRYLSGYGRERGGIIITFQNFDEVPLKVAYLESVPWFLKIYLHTLNASTLPIEDGTKVDFGVRETIIESMLFQPGQDRVRPTVIEFIMTLPPMTMTTIKYDFDRAFIKYTEHPPDANRGFDIGPGVLTIMGNNTEPSSSPNIVRLRAITGGRDPRIWTETLLIALPTPDFSMPYNVITMTCTITALFFGSLFNLLSRSFVPIEQLVQQPKKRWFF